MNEFQKGALETLNPVVERKLKTLYSSNASCTSNFTAVNKAPAGRYANVDISGIALSICPKHEMPHGFMIYLYKTTFCTVKFLYFYQNLFISSILTNCALYTTLWPTSFLLKTLQTIEKKEQQKNQGEISLGLEQFFKKNGRSY